MSSLLTLFTQAEVSHILAEGYVVISTVKNLMAKIQGNNLICIRGFLLIFISFSLKSEEVE